MPRLEGRERGHCAYHSGPSQRVSTNGWTIREERVEFFLRVKIDGCSAFFGEIFQESSCSLAIKGVKSSLETRYFEK